MTFDGLAPAKVNFAFLGPKGLRKDARRQEEPQDPLGVAAQKLLLRGAFFRPMSTTLTESKTAFRKSHLANLVKLLETCKTASEAEAITARIEELAGYGGVQ